MSGKAQKFPMLNTATTEDMEKDLFVMRTESPIKIRHANYNDLKQLMDLHYRCSIVQPAGFMFKLGRRFILEYYRILLKEKTSLLLCADAGMDGIVGLISANLDAKESLKWLKSGSYRLFLAALPALARKPVLIKEIYSRAKSVWGLVTQLLFKKTFDNVIEDPAENLRR
jgi:hypothetical protein